MQSVIELGSFLAGAKAAGMTEAERDAVVDHLSRNPRAGVLMPGTGGARKLRWKAPGRGKSGGYRVITYWAGSDVPVYLLDVFSKGEKVNLSQAERNALKVLLDTLAASHRRT